jgi:hypothetical protein
MEKGLKAIQEQAEKQSQEFAKNRINYLAIGDKEVAELRFLTDADGVIKAKIHTITEMTPKGKQFRKKYCTMQDIGSCTYCSAGEDIKSFIYLWAWVVAVYHTQQNPKLEKYADATKWAPVKLGDGKTYYKDTINGPMVFRSSVGNKGMYQNMLTGFARDYSSLIDRNYKYSRTGKELDTTYSLTPMKEAALSEEMIACMKSLPDLGDVISGKVTKFGQEDEPMSAAGEAFASEATPEEEAVPDETTNDIF